MVDQNCLQTIRTAFRLEELIHCQPKGTDQHQQNPLMENRSERFKQLSEPTSSRIRFLALLMAAFSTLIHDSFSSGLTARNTRLGTCRTHRTSGEG